MMKRIGKTLKENIIIIITIFIFILFCAFALNNFPQHIKIIDTKVQTFFLTKMLNNSNTDLMKNVTALGDKIAVISVFLVSLVLLRNKIKAFILTLDLGFILTLSLTLKAYFKRPRPLFGLIKTPITYSFPSGHTFFAVGFYGLLIYFLWKSKNSTFIKYILTFIISLIIIFVGISRVYLNVHYFTDVVAGAVLGILTVVLFINVYLGIKKGEIK